MRPQVLTSFALFFTSGLFAQQPAAPPPAQQQQPAPVVRETPSSADQPQPVVAPAAQGPGPGGEAPAGPNAYTLRRNVRLVTLDFVVVDSKGNAVRDLTKDEIHVTENGDPQMVRNFEAPGKFTPDPGLTINSTADLDRLAPNAPVNIVLLDEFNTLFEDMAFARYSLKKWLEHQPEKLDTPTMLVAVDLQHFTVLRDYTQDKNELISALDHHFVAYPWQAHQVAWKAERYANAILTLRRVAEATAGHPGHKNMIWVGRGFPTLNHAHVAPDDESHIHSAIQLTVNELRDARVTLYTIDPAGVMSDPGKYGVAVAEFAPFGGDPDFEQVAKATGGRSLHGRNDVDAEIGRSIRDGASFYSLSYRPTDTNYDTREFRRIQVMVDRPGLTVIARQGYFQERRPARVNEDGHVGRRLQAELIGAETSNMVYDAVPFTVQSSAADPNSYLVHVDGRGLVWSTATDTEPRHAKIILLVTTFDKKGKELKRDGKGIVATAPITVRASGQLDRPIDIAYKLGPDPKAVRARFVVRVEATGRLGTADVVPGRATMASSSGESAPAQVPTP